MRCHKIIGQGSVFNYWTVIGEPICGPRYNRLYPAKCRCGTIRNVESKNLRSGTSFSCGCRSKEPKPIKNQKKCLKCERTLPRSSFYSAKSKGGQGLFCHCMECTRIPFDKQKKKRRGLVGDAKIEWNKAAQKRWRQSVIGKKKQYESTKRYRKGSIFYRLSKNCRERVRLMVKVGLGLRENRTSDYLGCDWNKLKDHLESKFQPGMTWANYGGNNRSIRWEMDHVRPLASFNLSDESQRRAAFHYTNLQPMWGMENAIKSDKYAA